VPDAGTARREDSTNLVGASTVPPPYLRPHWDVLAATNHQPAGQIGRRPAAWVQHHGLDNVPNGAGLPHDLLDRHAVRVICRDPAYPALFGYICAMAWGSQDAGPAGPGHVVDAWRENATIAAHLAVIRAGGLTRCAAYNLFLGVGNVPGLGPSYWTKLLYFFSPNDGFYIMDQWTGKSIDFLTGTRVVRMNGNAVSTQNRCGNYQAYCEEVDAIANQLGVRGDQAEEMLMSKGGSKPWPWRDHVRVNWPAYAPMGRYSAAAMHEIYPHIPVNCF